MLNKIAQGSIVAISLLLVVSVASVATFQGWYSSFESSVLSDVEQKSSADSTISIEGIAGEKMYVKSSGADTFRLFQILDESGNVKCEIKDGSQSTLQADTVLMYTFDNTTYNGTHVLDQSGYGNNGTVNGATYTEDGCISGGCFEFDGSAEINLPSATLNNEVSFSFYIKPNSLNGDVFGFYIGPIYRPLMSFVNNKLVWQNINISIPQNTYSHIVFTGNSIDNISKVYLDGNLRNVSFVSSSFNSGATTGRNFNGTLDELAIYSKALSDEEVKELYEAKKAKIYEQLLSEGIKEVNISSCNLDRGKRYDVIGLTDTKKVEKAIIKR